MKNGKFFNRKEHKDKTRKERKGENFFASFAKDFAYFAVKIYLSNIY
jgi:hypothetical protein